MSAIIIFLAALALLLWAGWRVLREKSAEQISKEDAAATKRWAKLEKRGFWMHLLIRPSPFFAGLIILGPSFSAWRTTGQFVPVFNLNIIQIFGVSVGCLLGAFLDWLHTKEQAADAAKRVTCKPTA